MRSSRLRPITLAWLLAIALAGALRAEAEVPGALQPVPDVPPPLGPVSLSEPEATLEVWNRPIVTLRATFGARTPERRVELAAERIEDLPYSALTGEITHVPVSVGDVRGEIVTVEGRMIISLAEADIDAEAGEGFQAYVTHAIDNLRDALHARAEQREGQVLLRSLAHALPATLLFLAIVYLLSRTRSWLTRQASAASEESLRRMSRLGLDVRRQAAVVARVVATGLTWALDAVATYLWLTYVLVQFPYTEPWGHQLGHFLRETIGGLAQGLLYAVPRIVVIALIFLITRGAVAFVNAFFRNIERGWVRVAGFDAETARATRRLVVVLLWIFALTAAYPHIPGSHSEAFRGISVFVGLVVSLGSTGLVNQVMSGFVVIYSRAMRTGDWVRVGEVEGRVKEIGVLSTKLSTVRREEVAIPNAVLVGTATTNYTSLAGADGPLVTTAVTIGYDAPWRQVHALLELAASRTAGVRKSPEPRVLQRGLSDYYVEYQLLAHLERAEDRFEVLSALHANIQDAFNEAGVQIMSPHYVMQPPEPVIVPKEKWFARPAPPEPRSR
ncbi:MAG TPA: mechanosensitive ion channel domain-containing protein [Myxococcota bacterium]|nr:mechanosensitive ion channel domain-containing protein [Myxococcota bacterium]